MVILVIQHDAVRGVDSENDRRHLKFPYVFSVPGVDRSVNQSAARAKQLLFFGCQLGEGLHQVGSLVSAFVDSRIVTFVLVDHLIFPGICLLTQLYVALPIGLCVSS